MWHRNARNPRDIASGTLAAASPEDRSSRGERRVMHDLKLEWCSGKSVRSGLYVAGPGADGRQPRRSPPRGDEAAAGPGGAAVQPPILKALEGGAHAAYGGEQLLTEVFDLMRRRLPLLAEDDPARPYFAALTPALGEVLGRPPVVEAPTERLLG